MPLLDVLSPGRVMALMTAALSAVAIGVLAVLGAHVSCEGPCPVTPTTADGTVVSDRFWFLHRDLGPHGSITVRMTSMTGTITYPPPGHDEIVAGLVPWAKAGIIVKDGLRPGSRYAALMMTGSHGVRFQHDYRHDLAGRPGGVSPESPRWLRLTRSGDAISGAESADGVQWHTVGTAKFGDLPQTVQVGLFATSPGDLTLRRTGLGGTIGEVRFTQAVGVFDNVTVDGGGTNWASEPVGAMNSTDWEKFHNPSGAEHTGDVVRISGTGDIGPVGEDTPWTPGPTPGGLAPALAVVLIIAARYGAGPDPGRSSSFVRVRAGSSNNTTAFVNRPYNTLSRDVPPDGPGNRHTTNSSGRTDGSDSHNVDSSNDSRKVSSRNSDRDDANNTDRGQVGDRRGNSSRQDRHDAAQVQHGDGGEGSDRNSGGQHGDRRGDDQGSLRAEGESAGRDDGDTALGSSGGRSGPESAITLRDPDQKHAPVTASGTGTTRTSGTEGHATGTAGHATEPEGHTTGPAGHTTEPAGHTTGTAEHRTGQGQQLRRAATVGAVAFCTGLMAVGGMLAVTGAAARVKGLPMPAASGTTDLRIMVGLAVAFGLSAVIAFGIGALTRRRQVAAGIAILMIVLPYVITAVPLLPDAVSEWLLRVTPAAGFAAGQRVVEHGQVTAHYAPSAGFFPLPWWAGLAVLGAYAAVVLGLVLRRSAGDRISRAGAAVHD